MGDGDLLAQVDQVVANTLAALAAVGAGPSDVVRTHIWVASGDRTAAREVLALKSCKS